MGAFNEEHSIALLAVVTVDHSAIAATTLFTVPVGYRLLLDQVKIEAAGDEGITDISIGQSAALTDFIGVTQLDNLDAQYDAVKVQPIQANPPAKQKSYAAGAIIQVDVLTAVGNAGNTYMVFGTLKAI
jgi:hypothetical protein